jgi:signal transduction histidine kinase
VPALPSSVVWAFLSAGAALGVIVLAFGAALVLYQRRIVALHRAHAAGLLRAQEEERAWVAREVHDDALQRIAILLHELDGAAPAPRADALRAELEDLSGMLRRLAYRLHPAFLEREGLVPALRRLAADLERATGLRAEVIARDGAPRAVAPAQALVAYRVAQEALNNVVRHAGVAACSVTVATSGDALQLAVADEGRGFAVADRQGAGGLGMISMTERARAAGGHLTIDSQPGGGTTVRLRLPCVEPR